MSNKTSNSGNPPTSKTALEKCRGELWKCFDPLWMPDNKNNNFLDRLVDSHLNNFEKNLDGNPAKRKCEDDEEVMLENCRMLAKLAELHARRDKVNAGLTTGIISDIHITYAWADVKAYCDKWGRKVHGGRFRVIDYYCS